MIKYLENIKEMNRVVNDLCAATNRPETIAFPRNLTITATLNCNYRCKMCYQKSYKGELDFDLIEKIKQLLPFAKTVQLFGGEPFLYHKINELIDVATEYGCDITTITNGSLLTEEMCQAIVKCNIVHMKFSIDAGTPQTYKMIRGGNFFKVLKNVARITQLKFSLQSPKPDMHFNFLAMKANVAELSKLVVIATEIGVSAINVFYPSLGKLELIDECVFFCQEYCDEHLMKAKEVAARLGLALNLPTLFVDSSDTINYETKIKCRDPWDTLLIDINGDASICCGGFGKVGSLKTQSIEDFWNSKLLQNLRATINTPREPACCMNCRVRHTIPKDITLHIPNKELQQYALDRFKTPNPETAG